ncbi:MULTISPECIES: hypothetical protein [Hyphobacterium]|uniref:Uncharacterized protein n=1 Tax=Hyphobacterium vulgare TaxID=1736751 RepID=A0ABV6ZWC4_9PROT
MFSDASPDVIEYVIAPEHRAAVHDCVSATAERIDGFDAEFRDGDWYVGIREDENGLTVALIPYPPQSGMRGGDTTCVYDRETGDRIEGPTFGR